MLAGLRRVRHRRRDRPPLAHRPHDPPLRLGARSERSTEHCFATAVRATMSTSMPASGTARTASSTAVADGELRFRNTLVRDTAYEGLPYRRRRELHERVGRGDRAPLGRLDVEEEVSTLALHLLRGPAPRQGLALLPPGRRIVQRQSRPTSRRRGSTRGRWRLRAGCRHVSDDERAEYVDPAQRGAGGRRPLRRSIRGACAVQRASSTPIPSLRRPCTETARALEAGSGGSRRRLRETTTGLRLVEQLESKEAIAARANLHALRADIRLLPGTPAGDDRASRGSGRGGDGLAMPSKRSREPTRRSTAPTRCSESPRRPSTSSRRSRSTSSSATSVRSRMTELNLGVQAYSDGRWNEAVDWYRRARADCLDAGDRPRAALAGANLGELLVSQGAFDEAETVLTEARHVLRAAGRTPFALFAETQLARLSVARGFPDEASAGARAPGRGGPRDRPCRNRARDNDLLRRGDCRRRRPIDGAHRAGGAATGSMSDEAALLAVPLARVRASCLMALARDEEARACLAEALAGAERQGLLYEQLRLRQATVDHAGRTGIEVERRGAAGDHATPAAPRTRGLAHLLSVSAYGKSLQPSRAE